MAGSCRLASEVGFDIRMFQVSPCGGASGGGKDFRLADAIGSERPEQSRVGSLEPDEGENAWIKE